MSRKVVSYQVVEWLHNRTTESTRKIRRLLEDGYEPLGGVATAEYTNALPIIAQAFVKYEDEPKLSTDMHLYAVELPNKDEEGCLKTGIVRAESAEHACKLLSKAGFKPLGYNEEAEKYLGYGVTTLDKYNKVNAEVVTIL